jgi:phage-related protein
VILALCDAIIKMIPKVVETLFKLLTMLVDTMVKYTPHLVQAGFDLLMGILRGIRDNIRQVVVVSLQIIQNFIQGIADGLPGVIQSGVNLILAFVNGTANAIRNNSKAMGEAGGNLASAIIEGMINGLRGGVGKVASEAKRVAESAWKAAKDFLDINSPSRKFIELGKSSNEGMAKGLSKYAYMVEKPAENVGKTALTSLQRSLQGINDMIGGVIDIRPVITPEADLSGIQKQINGFPGFKSIATLDITNPIQGGSAAVSGYFNPPEQGGPATSTQVPAPITFNQYNSSPAALSPAEIYRQTKNQLSAAKEALPV